MRDQMKKRFLAAWIMLLILGTVNSAEASSSGRYLYDLNPYDINPKSWAVWRQSLSTQDWQEWCHDLNLQRWNWWRESMSAKNWRGWKEKMGQADKDLWRESTEMRPEILAREEQEEPALHFKNKVLKLKVSGQFMPPQSSKKAESPQRQTGGAESH